MKLSVWETLLLGMALSFLQALPTIVTLSSVEQAGLNGAITFLQQLLGGTVGTAK
jgi:hypothetical protein